MAKKTTVAAKRAVKKERAEKPSAPKTLRVRGGSKVVTVALGSTNEFEKRAVEAALRKLKMKPEVKCFDVTAGLGKQVVMWQALEQGARNRAHNANALYPAADYAIGIQWMLAPFNGRWFYLPCVFFLGSLPGRFNKQEIAIGYGMMFEIPQAMADAAHEKKGGLGKLVERLDPNAEKDPVKYLSLGLIKREDILEPVIRECIVQQWCTAHRGVAWRMLKKAKKGTPAYPVFPAPATDTPAPKDKKDAPSRKPSAKKTARKAKRSPKKKAA